MQKCVAIKLPTFNETNPELWFSRAESQFLVKGITSDTTKFHHLYALMTDKAANEIEALLLDPPKSGKVAAMKAKLVRRFGRSQYDKDTELLNTRTLGDLPPSQMWARFQRLNKDPSNATRTWFSGVRPVRLVNSQKCHVIFTHLWQRGSHLTEDLGASMWTWLVPFPSARVLSTFSPSWTSGPAGLRPSRSRT